MHSLEHTHAFHMARRIAKVIAPEFRVFATANLEPGASVLDLKNQTIEVSEGVDPEAAAAVILFHVGHLRLRFLPEFAEHFGKITDINERRLLKRISDLGTRADLLAAQWAAEVLANNFHMTFEEAVEKISPHVWNEDYWRVYYAA